VSISTGGLRARLRGRDDSETCALGLCARLVLRGMWKVLKSVGELKAYWTAVTSVLPEKDVRYDREYMFFEQTRATHIVDTSPADPAAS
jgi:hypothetical protein